MKIAASIVAVAVKENNLERFLEGAGASGRRNFKIPASAFSLFPEPAAAKLKSMRRTSSSFGGVRGKKVSLCLIQKSMCSLGKNSFLLGIFTQLSITSN